MNIEIARPIYIVLIPIMLGLIIYLGMRYLKIKQKTQAIVIRSTVAMLIIMALMGISIKWLSKNTTTIFLVDVSDSNASNIEIIEEYLRDTIKDMPANNDSAIVTFGDDTAIEQFVTDKKSFDTITTSPVSTSTDMENAISTALSMFSEDSAKRIVLITDGGQNQGDITNMTSAITAADVDLDVIELESFTEDEVYVDNVTLPDIIHVGDTYEVKVNIVSNVATTAKVSLYTGRTLKVQENVELVVGDNNFVFTDTSEETGTRDYKVIIESNTDSNTINNEYSAFTNVETKPKVLLVEGTPGIGDEFAKILEGGNIDYDKVTSSGTPTSVNEMLEYKSVITLDVYYDDMKQGFPEALKSYVNDHAGGYICIGGENSYAIGNYKDTPIEEILPVYMDLQGEKEIPKMAMVMVIDHSGSMTSPAADNSSVTGLDLAKQSAIVGIENLRKTDEAGVLAFDDTFKWAVPITTCEDKQAIQTSIATINYGGGTSIYPSLQEATKELEKSEAQLKHIILLTDGQDGYTGYDDITTRINDDGITLSTVAVGSDADFDLLNTLAKDCGGRSYSTDVNTALPRIFAQEVYLSAKSYLVNRTFTPVITNSSPITSEILSNGCPSLYGYVASTAKATSTVILESDEGDPILSTWQCGLGKTVAWNSDGTNEWTKDWANWENYSTFWKNIVDYTITDTSLGNDSVDIVKSGNGGVVTYTTDQYKENTVIKGVITGEDGEAKEITLDPVAPGVFESDIDLNDTGVYSISLRNMEEDTVVKNINTATSMQYSPEYKFAVDTGVLESFVSNVDGKIIDMESDVFKDKLESVKARIDLTIIFIVIALIIFMVDIVCRRFRLGLASGIKAKIKEQAHISTQKQVSPVSTTKKDSQNPEEFITEIHSIESPPIESKSTVKPVKNNKVDKKNKPTTSNKTNEVAATNTVAELLKKKKDRDI